MINWDNLLGAIFLAGVAISAIAIVWLVVLACRTHWAWGVSCLLVFPMVVVFALLHGRRSWKPALVLTVGLGLIAFPPILTRILPIDLGPYERVVDGERHLTLTGWDRHDYGVIAAKPDTIVLQMANADVTDATLANLRSLEQLRELDLNNTKVTDAGLQVLRVLPHLQSVRLKNTAVTDSGFRASFMNLDNLLMLELSGTGVTPATVKEWKAAKPKRKALL